MTTLRHYNYIILSLLLIALGFLLSSCGQQSVKTTSPDDAASNVVAGSSADVSSSDREAYRDGITALYNGELSTAERTFRGFIKQYPNLAGAYSNLALIALKQEKYDEAMKLVEKALSLNPAQAQAYNLRAQLNVQSGKIHEAKADYLKAVELKPDYVNAQYNLALLYDIYLQDIPLALQHYNIYMSLLKQPDEAVKEWINHLKGSLNNA